LHKSEIEMNPIIQFSSWFKEAKDANLYQPEAMTLATVSKQGKPSARIVLLKEFDENGFVFFTNYGSHKGKELLKNPFAALVFFWPELHRQVRIEGDIEKTTNKESSNYFTSRPRESQIGAWASNQSTEMKNREELEHQFVTYKSQFKNKQINCPPFWGGFRLIPGSFEFWQGRENRLNDRFLFKREGNSWQIIRLAP
jgi:pyridoxamine 5'-phosphate oxidase